MCPMQVEGRATTTGLVGHLLYKSSVKARADEHRVEPARRDRVEVTATETHTPAGPGPDPMRSAIRDVLGKFLELNEPVSQLVDRFVEVFVQQPSDLDEFRLQRVVGQITDTITALDWAIAKLLKASEEARVGPPEYDRKPLKQSNGVLKAVHSSLTQLAVDASASVANPESRQASLNVLRTQMDKAWRATTILFKIASDVVTRLLDQLPEWTASSEAISGAGPTFTGGSKPKSSAQAAANV